MEKTLCIVYSKVEERGVMCSNFYSYWGAHFFTQLAILPATCNLTSTTKGETDIDPKKGTSKLSSTLRADCYSSACTSDNAPQHKVTKE